MTELSFCVIIIQFILLILLPQTNKLILTAVLAIVMPVSTMGFFRYVDASPSIEGLDYVVVSKPGLIQMAPGEHRMVDLVIQNVSSNTWSKDIVSLNTAYTTGDIDRPSTWVGAGWESDTKIRWAEDGAILPGKKAAFRFELAAPSYSGWYKEHFVLQADTLGGLMGDEIVLTIQVGDPTPPKASEEREIVVYRSSQQSVLMEDGYVVATLPISSGKAGYTTPAGTYRIFNHAQESYSQRYKLYMSNWMGLTKEGGGYEGYGLHSLAYWKTAKQIYPDGTIKNGRLYVGNRVYEDAVHLGTPMSHGCVRYGIRESDIVFGWAENGTKVTVV